MSALIFEKSVSGRRTVYLPDVTSVPVYELPEKERRTLSLDLPELSENDVSRHYTELEKMTHGVNDGFYPLGSCTMKYNPKVNEALASLPGFTDIHPLAPADSVQGALRVLKTAEEFLTGITGMSRITFQPAAGAHGEFTGLLLIKAYHESRGDFARKISLSRTARTEPILRARPWPVSRSSICPPRRTVLWILKRLRLPVTRLRQA